MSYKRFEIKGHFFVDIDDVLAFLKIDNKDYNPTNEEWLECAKKMFEDDNFDWMDYEVKEN